MSHPLESIGRKALEDCIGRLGALSLGQTADNEGICCQLYSELEKFYAAGKFGPGEGQESANAEHRYDQATDVLASWLRGQFEEWPRFSGCRTYPVPAPADFGETLAKSRQDAAYWNLDRWAGEYGAARVDLAAFLKQRLTEALANHPGSAK